MIQFERALKRNSPVVLIAILLRSKDTVVIDGA